MATTIGTFTNRDGKITGKIRNRGGDDRSRPGPNMSFERRTIIPKSGHKPAQSEAIFFGQGVRPLSFDRFFLYRSGIIRFSDWFVRLFLPVMLSGVLIPRRITG